MHPASLAAAGTPRQRKWRTWPAKEIGRAGGGRPPWRLERSLQVGGHEVRVLELRRVQRAEMPGPGRGALGSILLIWRKLFWK